MSEGKEGDMLVFMLTRAFPSWAFLSATRHGSPSMKRLKEKKSGLKWMHPKFDDSRWPQAKVLGNHGDEDWKVRLYLQYLLVYLEFLSKTQWVHSFQV